MSADFLLKEIGSLTGDLMRKGVCDSQNFPVIYKGNNEERLVYSGFKDVSVAMKDISYEDIYKYLDENGQYNFKLADGGIFHLLYTFDRRGVLKKHRLCYFPSSTFEPFQSMPELYMDEGCLYKDVTSKSILPIPVRVDYDPCEKVYQEVLHPKSHITFGQYKNCRIPVVSPLCPITFVNFILSSFYNTSYLELDLKRKVTRFDDTIADREREILHFSIV